MDDVGTRIRRLREAQGRSLTEVASKCSISKGYLSSIESGSGQVNPTLDVLRRIAGVLDVTIGELVGAPKRRAKGEADDWLDRDLPDGLRELIEERKAAGRPLDSRVVRWLASAQFRGKRPRTKRDFDMLLMVLGEDDPE